VQRSCGDDAALRDRVLQMLSAHASAGNFLASPALGPLADSTWGEQSASSQAISDFDGRTPLISPNRFDGMSNEQLQAVNAVCDEFEQALPEQGTISIEDLVAAAPEPIRPLLFEELLAIEFEYRLKGDEFPDIAEYEDRFPDSATAVRNVLVRVLEMRTAAASQRTSNPAAKTSDAAEIPKGIGRYRVESMLGEGGFGIVYLAHDEHLGRPVAIKVPHARMVSQSKNSELYLAEARSAAILDHPHIVPVFDFGTSDELGCYFVSKYIEGTDLARKLKQGRPSHLASADLITMIARALQHAHDKGVVHRDVKPSNILIDRDERPYLMDFGLALRNDCVDLSPRFVGTPAYMSPEQIRGEGHRVDGRSDIFSLGVVFYELLAGQRPFLGETQLALLEQVVRSEPRPPREHDKNVPKELQRVCLKALAKRVRERYSSAQEMADDIQLFLAQLSRGGDDVTLRGDSTASDAGSAIRIDSDLGELAAALDSGTSSSVQINKIMPKGLRSFDKYDASFFLELLPGPRDREGLPDRIRFWKEFAEDMRADHSRAVGLVYGPSGCGKSSLVKAGLLPRLSGCVVSVYVESAPRETEMRLLTGLRNNCPELPAHLGLKDAIANLRSGDGLPPDKKILIVLDQFEQWLHADKQDRGESLVEALRQCDGSRVQCIVIVRDDFWMAATRFMGELEIRLLEGHNADAVDLFTPRHAEKVLIAYGQAFGVLPQDSRQFTQSQRDFVKQAVAELSENNKIVCVRLALFAQMMKDKEWKTQALKRVGGMNGLGVIFLEESLGSSADMPEHRCHGQAARALLQSLIPDWGTDIKCHPRAYHSLMEAAGYLDRPKDFEDLIRILDSELRLITPVSAESLSGNAQTDSHRNNDQKSYQLTHDYLVPSLRTWLTRTQQETRRGRAQLRLAERSTLWSSKPERSLLPTLIEFLNMWWWTDKAQWTVPQRKLMGQAGRLHGMRTAGLMAAVLIIAGVVQQVWSKVDRGYRLAMTQTAVLAVENASSPLLPHVIQQLDELPREMVLQELGVRLATATDREKISLALAQAHFGAADVQFLISEAMSAPAIDLAYLCKALSQNKDQALSAIRDALVELESSQQWRPMARLAIVALHLGEASWARDMCRLIPDRIQRTIFIDEYTSWHGDLAQIAEAAGTMVDPAWRSGICLALGNVSAEDAGDFTIKAWRPVLLKWFLNDGDGGVHSAAAWTLRRWNLELPEVPSSKQPRDGTCWHVNSLGMTMLTIPAGTFTRKDRSSANAENQVVTLTKAFWLCDREINVGTFRKFATDTECPAQEKPAISPEEQGAGAMNPTDEHPIQNANWYDAVLFCNWLSRREGLTQCYERTGMEDMVERRGLEEWQLLPDTNGYRLPTEAEWELACRAGTSTTYHFGDDVTLLDRYAVTATWKTDMGGDRLPNSAGLFDMMGNVLEWCEDWSGPYDDVSKLIDPRGIAQGTMRVMRGGTYFDPAEICTSGARNRCGPWGRGYYNGFRVARTVAF
jgi:serine/threonine protein kinase/formylglycine-generating enzyme required for sulfatase activity